MSTSKQPLALLSVTDKIGLPEFAQSLSELGYQIMSTGGTAKLLRDKGLEVLDVSEYTGSPEIMNGRVKSLHPKVHGGILYDRNNPSHVTDAVNGDIRPIDIVVVNLYKFQAEAVEKSLPLETAIEHIDIGGPTMLRAAAKNWEHTLSVIDPTDYPNVIEALRNDSADKNFRVAMSAKVFQAMAAYNGSIANYLQQEASKGMPANMTKSLELKQGLRYGENPHQKAGFYKLENDNGFADAEVLQGKELSYNNLLDLDAACALVTEFSDSPAVAIIKHTNPCGCAAGKDGDDLVYIYKKALTGDPKSAFGGIIATNESIDKDTALAITGTFTECIAAPEFSPEALEIFSAKKNLRLLKVPFLKRDTDKSNQWTMRSIRGGMLVQSPDLDENTPDKWKSATKAKASDYLDDLIFANRVCKHVKSNAIVYVKDRMTITIGAGQMSRIDSAEFAAQKALNEDKVLEGAVMASDAFFPFRDTVDNAAKYGIKAIVQPGGSKRDDESIAACDEAGIAMVFTGERHFRH
jgi:phosphoribosylaminoimidazolecarboxamide formyltransferase / IMP cyclohydrolase